MSWLYTIDYTDDEPILLLDAQIGDDGSGDPYIDGALFAREILQLDRLKKKRIQVWINSPGGSVYDGMSIFNAILNSETPVDTYNTGICASIAGVCFMAGRKRVMNDYSLMMVHPPAGGEKKVLDAMKLSLVMMIAGKSAIKEDKITYLMDRTTWLSASDCFENGFCTEIAATSEKNRKRMPQTENVTALWKEAVQITNSLLPSKNSQNNTDMSYTKVTNKLGLIDAANEDQIVESIKVIQDKMTTAERALARVEDEHTTNIKTITDKAAAEKKVLDTKVTELSTELETSTTNLTTVTNSLTAKTKEYDDIKAKFDAMEKEKNDAVEAKKVTDATTMVDIHVKNGRIKNDVKVIANWVKLATTDFDGTKEIIEAIPLNGKAVDKIETSPLSGSATGIHATNTAALAARNRLKRQGKEIPA